MNVLSIGTDRSLLNTLSVSSKRHVAYGAAFGELHIIVFTKRGERTSEVLLAPGTHVHATNSLSRLLYGIDAIRIARRLQKPDVVTVQDPFETGLVGLLVAWLFNVPLHVQVHTDFLGRAYAQHSALNRIRRIIARIVLPRARRIRVVSERIKSAIERIYAPRVPIAVLPIYVDIEQLRSVSAGPLSGRFSQFDLRFLVVSRLEPEKNVLLALESFASLAAPRTCLIIVGDGSQKSMLEQYVEQHGLVGTVFFEGETLAYPYYAVADAVLVPSRYEGYGLVIVEALAAGRPVIATDVGVAQEAGAIVTSEKQFATTMKEWVEHGERTGQLHHYPYTSFQAYVQAYCEDIRAASQTS